MKKTQYILTALIFATSTSAFAMDAEKTETPGAKNAAKSTAERMTIALELPTQSPQKGSQESKQRSRSHSPATRSGPSGSY